MEGGRQLRLLLWRDYLIRKRNFITLAGVLWASGIMFGIYTVRMNIDNEDFPTCQFPARALPSAGMIPFLQSFICSANNECSPMDQFEEIPAYNNSKLTKLQKKVAPLLNDSVLELASTLPDAVKLLATVADVADEPNFMDVANNGLKVRDLFTNPKRVKRYVSSQLQLDDDLAQSLMTSKINLQGILNMKIKKNCTSEFILDILIIENPEHSLTIANKLCSINKEEMENIVLDLLHEMNLSKYVKMLGNMYFKLSGDNRLVKLGDFVTALLRMTKATNLIPSEIYGIWFGKQSQFSYLDVNIIQKFIDLFEPTFGDTEEFKSIREVADVLVAGAQYLNNVFGNISNDTTEQITNLMAANLNKPDFENDINKIGMIFKNVETESIAKIPNAIDPFEILTKILKVLYKFIPANERGEVLFYSTLLTKLLESANKVIEINTNLEELTYNVTLRNPKAADVITNIPLPVIVKGFEALANPERTQILSSNSDSPDKVFCDVKQLQNLFLIEKKDAEQLKTQLCNDVWINYIKDLIESFGFYDIKNSINQMASMFIQKTLGHDVSSQLYTLEYDISVLKKFTLSLVSMDSKKQTDHQWNTLLKVKKDSPLMKTFEDMSPLGKLILITVHGTLAKEIVSQNKILEFKISPILKDSSAILGAVLEQMNTVDAEVTNNFKLIYGDALKTVLLTALDENKTYKSLSTYSEDIFCHGVNNASEYVVIPDNVDKELLISTLCQASMSIENGLRNDSILAQQIIKMVNDHTRTLNWTLLITNIQNVYIKLSKDYPYVFEYSSYNMSNDTQQFLQKLYKDATKYWFSLDGLQRGLHLSVKLGFRLLDLLDHGIFNLKSDQWLKLKHITNSAIGPLVVIDDTIKLVTDLMTNKDTSTSELPYRTANAMSKIFPNIGQLLVDGANLLINDTTDIEPIISLMNEEPQWPCSDRSLSELLKLTQPSKDAVIGMETLLCINQELVEEWMQYFKDRKIHINKAPMNNTEYDPHLFLRMSSVFDSLVNDTNRIKETLNYIQNENNGTNRIGLITGWKYAVKTLNTTDKNIRLRKFFNKVDAVLNAIEVSVSDNASMNNLWEQYVKCINASFHKVDCRNAGRAAWKYSLQTLSLIFDNIADDLLTYFTEVNEPGANPLQVLGFTKSTSLYMLYDKLPEFISVLVNSYWDFGFMSQIRRASITRFWDCDAVVSAMTPALDSAIHQEQIERVKPYLCPSFIYWLSLPRGDNVFFNIVAKPQYYIYSHPVQQSTSIYENAFLKAILLSDFVQNNMSKDDKSVGDQLKPNSLKDKFSKLLDDIVNYRINETSPSYIEFHNMYRKQFSINVYLTRIVGMTNKIAQAFNELNFSSSDNSTNKLNSDIGIIRNMFKRKAVDVTALHFDVITDVLWENDERYTIVEAMKAMCNGTKKSILFDEDRTKMQICAKNYSILYEPIQNIIMNEYQEMRQSLINLVNVTRGSEFNDVTDVFEYMNERKQLQHSLKHSIKFAYDLGLPHFLKYLQTNLQSQRILISFLTGGDWWNAITHLYNGEQTQKFFGFVEQTFEVADNILNNLDEIHLVRLIHDLNVNESDAFCRLEVSDYLPDSTGVITSLTRQICDVDKVEIFKELPPLLYASQGYEAALKVSKDIDYISLHEDILLTERQIKLMANGPKEPQRPGWVTDERIKILLPNLKGVLSKEKIATVTFGIMRNIVDAGTLFLNSSQCKPCSKLTSWFKQLNLQVIKKQEYENLLCHINSMDLDEIHRSLKNDFHWDMFIREVISSRNYTKYELNKSMNEFLGLVKVHFLEDLSAGTNKITECVSQNITRNGFGTASIFVTITAYVTRLLRAETPHLQEIEGIKDLPYLNHLFDEVSHKMQVEEPLKRYLVGNVDKELMTLLNDQELVSEIMDGDLDLAAVQKYPEDNIENIIILNSIQSWDDICENHDCTHIQKIIMAHLDLKKIQQDLATLQPLEYWKFPFVSSILQHIESFLLHTGRILGISSNIDIDGVIAGRIDSIIDAFVSIFMDDNIEGITFSIEGILTELKPLLENTELSSDISSLSNGLKILYQFKKYLIEEQDLKLRVAEYFPSNENIELGLTKLGINNTNFWSIAAPRIADGYINLKPILTSKNHDPISSYVCELDQMSLVIQPGFLDVVTQDDVMASVAEQFCKMDNDVAKQVMLVLLSNFQYTPIIDQVKEMLLSKLFSASDLTSAQGSTVLRRLPRMSELLPPLQNQLEGVMQLMADEPLLKRLRDFSSVGNLMSSSDFLADAGRMMCGKPFKTDMSRIIQNIIKTKDQNREIDQAQLDGLPTDYCRSMYKEIISMEGGKIVWSFIKPLIMGRILFTPQTPPVLRIMRKVNETFEGMIRMTDLVHEFAGAVPSLDSISSHREGLEALQRMLSAPGMEKLKTQILGKDVDINIDIEKMFEKFGDMKGMEVLLRKASSLLRCIRLNRLMGVDDEDALTHNAAKLVMVNEFSAGLVFLNTDKLNDSLNHVEYKIRMDIENAPTTVRMHSYLWVPGPEASFIENMRYFRGFVQIQDLVDTAIINLSAEKTRSKREVQRHDDDWTVYTQQMPYPCYRKDYFQTSLYESQALVVGFFFSMLFTVTAIVRFIVADKETGNTMLMSVMGVNLKFHTLSWFLTSLVEVMLTVACVTLILKWGLVLPKTDPTLIFVLLFIYGLSILSFCYLMSKLFTSASFAAVCSGILYMISFMPYVIIISLEAVMTSSFKFVVCLAMSSSLCYAFLFIMRFEAMGIGTTWSMIMDSPIDDEMNIAYSALMMLLDAIIYFIIGLCIDRYFGAKTVSSNIINCESEDAKAGVSIVGVTKVYGEGSRSEKVALDNVSMELHRGQITTLLGHNGAGKTTLIKILTGMLKPTKGHITVRGEGKSVGVCPQHDVLVECLTCREHVALYAQIHGHMDKKNLDDEVDRMLRCMSLEHVADRLARCLSGGTRRRLCVALAFLARAHLVVLDEPTAGVDPNARRDIWSMIVKLKQDRTILITTHHLDEAEILSDQVVIMHKGQIHTTGSPIELKRSLGTGYKLSLTLADKQDGDVSTEESAQRILTTLQGAISNAKITDLCDRKLEIALPFYNEHGTDNNMLQLCTTLEENEAQLGVKNYSLDCSTLEQVFCDICQQVDNENQVEYDPTAPETSKSSSTSSMKSDRPLVEGVGSRRGTRKQQFIALMKARYLHFVRNRWLLIMLIGLPIFFITVAMAFSTLRPPADNEISLPLTENLYYGSTEFIVPHPSMDSSNMDPKFLNAVLYQLQSGKASRNWTEKDNPKCNCTKDRQVCEIDNAIDRPEMMVVPDVNTLNEWLVKSQELYISKRYGGFTSTIYNNKSYMIAWYNNKGHHALPSYLNAVNNAILRTKAGNNHNITTYSHPMKISKEQISKDTVYQHIADAGVSALVLIALSLAGGGGAVPLVRARTSKEKRLQYLSAVSPQLYWTTALLWDLGVMFINMLLTAGVMMAFGFPVFVARNNLPAICILIMLYGFACGSLVHLLEKLFTDASLANMMLFCGNAFCGLVGITILLILDIISESDATDNARWALHKIFLLSPQFALGDGMLEVAKNTVQAQVLQRFGMDTYRDPLHSSLLVLHYSYLVVVGVLLFTANLALECGYMHWIGQLFKPSAIEEKSFEEPEEVTAERRRVSAAKNIDQPLSVSTIGNINRGFVHTEGKKNSLQRSVSWEHDVMSCEALTKLYGAPCTRAAPALRSLTLGVPPGQCLALLGENGAGKSTTFSLLTGEISPTEGNIYINGKLRDSRGLCRGLISYCPQTDAIDPLLTVRETLEFYCSLRGITDEEDVISRTLEMFNLRKYSEVRTGALSGGNKRKLCAALAFMGRAPLVLLDEPTSGMDPVSRRCVWRGCGGAGRALVLSTHALDDARALATRVALLARGQLLALAPLDQCLRRFGGGYVVAVRCGAARGAWRRVRLRAPHAALRVLHHHTLHFLLPATHTVEKKEVVTKLSDIFRLMADLQTTCDIEDFTINHSTLDQMFLNFSEKPELTLDSVDIEPIQDLQKNNEHTITAL